jgi:FkbM family methyltransferase
LKVLWDRDSEPGFYVDIGCFHPTEYSNTYLLYLVGWRGLVIDADPTHLSAYQTVRPNDIVVNVAVGDEPGERIFFTFQDRALNTLSPQVAQECRARGHDPQATMNVKIERLDAILRKHNAPKIGFMNIDVEGLDLNVLSSNDWTAYRPDVLAIEDHQISLAEVNRSPTYRFLSNLGYTLHSKVHYTSIYISN